MSNEAAPAAGRGILAAGAPTGGIIGGAPPGGIVLGATAPRRGTMPWLPRDFRVSGCAFTESTWPPWTCLAVALWAPVPRWFLPVDLPLPP